MSSAQALNPILAALEMERVQVAALAPARRWRRELQLDHHA
jgi:hypothetical protein